MLAFTAKETLNRLRRVLCCVNLIINKIFLFLCMFKFWLFMWIRLLWFVIFCLLPGELSCEWNSTDASFEEMASHHFA